MSARRRARLTPAAVAAGVLACVLTVAGCGGDGQRDDPDRTDRSDSGPVNPLAGKPLWTNPGSSAAQAARDLRESGDEQGAQAAERIAAVPTATWLGGEDDTRAKTRQLTTAAQAAGQVPVLVAYNLPERDCGQYSRGGAGSPAEYLTWTREAVAGVGDRPAVVVLEPDAIAHAIVGCDGARAATDRYRLLEQAVGEWTSAPAVSLYMDAGNSSWVTDTGQVADALRASGVQRAAGFSLNVSNFEPTDDSYRYGRAISDHLGGAAQFVIDTSRNGVEVPNDDWCNPSGARLGQEPTTEARRPLLDALLWIKQPGDSDGTCKPGAPDAGRWWPPLAGSLTTNG